MDTASQATQLFGLFWMMDTAVVLRDGLGDLMTIGLPCPLLIILMTSLMYCHCERSEAISIRRLSIDQ